MEFDITVSRYDVGKCPHCRKTIKMALVDCAIENGDFVVINESVQKMVQICEQWAKDHPVRASF